jgi:prepilin-type N-terminal cleavage/methylation domain-containing protein
MPILATGKRRTPDKSSIIIGRHRKSQYWRARGFSLIELLVAVFVIVLLTGVVSLNVGRGGADLALESEVRHVSGLLAFASAEAGMSGADHGLLLGRDDAMSVEIYQGIWLRRYDQGWALPRSSTEVFAPLPLAEGYELQLTLEGQPDIELQPYDPELNMPPQIIAWAGGEMTPGALEWRDIRTGDVVYRLEWDLLGRMTTLPRGVSEDLD